MDRNPRLSLIRGAYNEKTDNFSALKNGFNTL